MAGRGFPGVVVDAGAAWAASCAAVEAVCGEPPPMPPQRRGRGGRYFTRRYARLRKLGVYTAICGLGASGRGVAASAGLCHKTVQAFLSEMEDRRDDPALDALLERLRETAVLRMAAGAARRVAA